MLCQTFSLGDLYEIHYTPTAVTAILRYRRGEDGPGELVNFDTLPLKVQDDLYRRLRKALTDDRKSQQSTSDSDSDSDSSFNR